MKKFLQASATSYFKQWNNWEITLNFKEMLLFMNYLDLDFKIPAEKNSLERAFEFNIIFRDIL